MQKKKGYPYWQMQDNVPASVIQGFTKTCKHEDFDACRVSFRMGESTLAGVANWYDRQGNHIIQDNNRFTGTICCSKCWRSGVIDNNGNMLEEYPGVDE